MEHPRAATCFSPRDRRMLAALAEATMPAGRIFPPGGEPAVARLESFLAPMAPLYSRGYRALLLGADGAAMGRELSERGVAVVFLEEGEWFGREQFTGRPVDMQRKMFRDMGATFTYGNCNIPIPMGRTVGGSTTINSGTCYRTPERVFGSWRERHGLADFSSETMDPYYRRVEEVLGVSEARAEHLGGVARVIGRGCDALG